MPTSRGAGTTDVAEHARAALLQSRITGAPFLAALLGTRAVRPSPAHLELRFDSRLAPITAPLGVLDVAMLADLALGGALRTRVGIDRTLPTLSLTLQLDDQAVPAEVRARAWGGSVAGGTAGAQAELVAGRRGIGRALATFAVPASAPAASPMPWEQVPENAVAERGRQDFGLSQTEQQVLAVVRDLANGGEPAPGGRSWTEQFLLRACADPPAGDEGAEAAGRQSPPPALRCQPTVAMTNRAGHVQGAVLYALATIAACRVVNPTPVRFVSGHMVFATAARVTTPIAVVPVLLHAARQTLFVRTELHQDDRLVAEAAIVLRRSA